MTGSYAAYRLSAPKLSQSDSLLITVESMSSE